MIAPKTQNTRGAGGAASVQSRSLAEQNLHSTQQAEREAPRPKLDHALINRSIPKEQLSKTWAFGYRRTHVLPPQPHIATSYTRGDCRGLNRQLKWFNPITGVGGVGAISLVANVLKISEDAAAWRLAQWLAAEHGYDANAFIDATSQTEKGGRQ
jgi:hypothetical protein